MAQNPYRETLQATLEKLVRMRGEIFDCLLQLAVTGELKEWADAVPVGECHTFSTELFAACDDANMQILVRLLNRVEQTADSLCNINALDFPGESRECVI